MGQPTTNGAGRARTQGIIRSARVWLAASQGCCRSYSHITYPPPMAAPASFLHRQKPYRAHLPRSSTGDSSAISSASLNKVGDKSNAAISVTRRVAWTLLVRYSIFYLKSFRYGSLNISKLGSALTLIRSEARGMHSLARGLCPLRMRGSIEHLIRTRYRCEFFSRARHGPLRVRAFSYSAARTGA